MSTYHHILIDRPGSLAEFARAIAAVLDVPVVAAKEWEDEEDALYRVDPGSGPAVFLTLGEDEDDRGLPLSSYRFSLHTQDEGLARSLYRAIERTTDWRIALVLDELTRQVAHRDLQRTG